MRRHTFSLFIAAGLLLAAAFEASAQGQHHRWCMRLDATSLDQIVASCTVVLESKGQPRETLVAAHTNRARALKERGDATRALEDLDRALQLDAALADAYVLRGEIFFTAGLAAGINDDHDRAGQAYARAVESFDRAIALAPDVPQTYVKRGHAHYELDQREPALADYNQAADLDADYAEAYYGRFEVKMRLGQFGEGMADCERARRLNPAARYTCSPPTEGVR
jgi:tetratricopeptide (TPR) repeat protein